MKTFNSLFTWDSPYGDYVILHNDGACSVMIEWDGLDIDMMTVTDKDNSLSLIRDIITRFDNKLTVEAHLWREFDDSPARRFLAYSKNIKRNHSFALKIRTELANHLGPQGISNSVAFVLTYLPDNTPSLFLSKELNKETERAEYLLGQSSILSSTLPGGKLSPVNRYADRIIQTYQRRRFLSGFKFSYDPIFNLSDQIISDAPCVKQRVINIDGQFTKILFGFKYPDANPGWIVDLVSQSFPMHIMHSIKSIDTRDALAAAGSLEKNTEGLIVGKGDDYQSEKTKDLKKFRNYVAGNGLSVLLNMFVIHLYGQSKNEVEKNARIISAYFEKIVSKSSELTSESDDIENNKNNQAGDLRDADYIQKVYIRRGLPGQSYLANRFRPDEHEQITNMFPIQVWSDGDKIAETLSLTKNGQLVTHSFTDKALLSTFIGGMTRSGKDAANVSVVAQLAPLGVNYKFIEIGSTYRWVCEANSGKYCVLNPDESVIAPLPPNSIAHQCSSKTDTQWPLSSGVVGSTSTTLAPLLTNNHDTLNRFEQSAAESALQYLYASPDKDKKSPVLSDYLYQLDNLDKTYHTHEQIKAAKSMAQYLDAFLSGPMGDLFNRQDNIDLEGDFVGLDLSEIWSSNKELAVFYLSFASLRFAQDAFANAKLTYTYLNELHLFVELNPGRIKTLCSSLSRMGGKKASPLGIITQHTSEVDALDEAVISQMADVYLCYMKSDHDHIGDKLKLDKGVLERWSSFKYPVGLPYREQIFFRGDSCYHHHLSLPEFLLNLADTSPKILELKDKIANEVTDPMERMDRLNFLKRGI